MNTISLKLMCIFYSLQMACSACVRFNTTPGFCHSRCRSHSECARGYRYSSYQCGPCKDLWRAASDLSSPWQAFNAYNILHHWVRGFARNSRHLPAPYTIWEYEEERLEFKA